MGPLGPRSATDLEGLYQGPHRSQSRTGTTRRTWTTNLLRHRDYGIDCRHSGDSPPAHIGTAPRARSSSATRPAGRRYPPGCGPEQRIGGREDSEADYCRRTRRSNGYVMLPSRGRENATIRECGALSRLANMGSIRTPRSNGLFRISDVATLRGSIKEDGDFNS